MAARGKALSVLSAIVQERQRRRRREAPARSIESLLFDRQLSVCWSLRSRTKALIAGRGAGKSSAAAAKFLQVAQRHRGALQLCVSVTREQARRTVFEPLRAMAAAAGIEVREPDQQGRVYFGNGSLLYLAGVDKWPELRKYRGTPWDFVFIDECGELSDEILAYLVHDVVEPRMMDKDWSELWCGGTPGIVLAGTWFDITGPAEEGGGTAVGWDVHRWDARGNPHVDAQRYFGEVLERRAWDDQHPTFLREYLGQWVADSSRLVLTLPEERIFDALPPGDWTRVLSLDFGVVDDCAFCVLWYSPDCPYVWVVRSWERAGLSPSEASQEIAQALIDERIHYVIGDAGGIGKAFIQEFSRRQSLNITSAQKDEKATNLRLIADEIPKRFCYYRPGTEELVEQSRRLVWDDKRSDIHSSCRDHQFHAQYYGWRYVYPRLGMQDVPKPPADTFELRTQAKIEEMKKLRPEMDDLDSWAID